MNINTEENFMDTKTELVKKIEAAVNDSNVNDQSFEELLDELEEMMDSTEFFKFCDRIFPMPNLYS